jgi:hypothetical protein
MYSGSGNRPFNPTGAAKRANDAWTVAQLEPIGLHDARHAAASILIAAGVNAKALSVYMGHASPTITLDRYGHLFPGNEEEAAALIDSYLDRIGGADRVQLESTRSSSMSAHETPRRSGPLSRGAWIISSHCLGDQLGDLAQLDPI